MKEVYSYAKNHNIGFTVPCVFNGVEKSYYPDFVVRIDDGHGTGDLLNLIIEVTGELKSEKAAKVETTETLWVPAINNHGGFGRWAFLEIKDPWDAIHAIRSFLGKTS
jgi:type III restriction enzyme